MRYGLLSRSASARDFNVAERNTLRMSCAKAAAIGDRLAVDENKELSLRLRLLRRVPEIMNTSRSREADRGYTVELLVNWYDDGKINSSLL